MENEDKTMANISTTITIADKTYKITRFRGYITFCHGKVLLYQGLQQSGEIGCQT